MIKMKKNTVNEREYTAPVCRVSRYEMRFGLCVSVTELNPVEEEDAGISEWGN